MREAECARTLGRDELSLQFEGQAFVVRVVHPRGQEVTVGYHRWTEEHARTLASVLAPVEMDRFIWTPRYWASLAVRHRPYQQPRPMSLSTNWRRVPRRSRTQRTPSRRADLSVGAAGRGRAPSHVRAGHRRPARARRGLGRPLPQWAATAGLREAGIGLAIPAIVLDEIDKNKTNAQPVRGTGTKLKTRARAAQVALMQLFANSPGERVPLAGDDRTRPMYAFLQDRPLRQVPIPIADNDLIEFGLQLRPFAGSVTESATTVAPASPPP